MKVKVNLVQNSVVKGIGQSGDEIGKSVWLKERMN